MKLEKTTYFIIISLIAGIFYSCASIGRPEGGPKDVDPPVFVSSNPAPNAINYNKSNIELQFNEFIVLKDQSTKVVVSPAQKENPTIRANGKKINIEFKDTLKENTTYVIDFSDAIQDNNEGNPLSGFSFAFATGGIIDTLQVSGIVLNARDLEPQKGIFVGLHSCLDDSAFRTKQLERIARTNELGQFTIRNIKPGKYHIFALNDADRDYKFARSEDLAFLNEIIVPTVAQIETMDTIFTSQMVTDTIYQATHSLFLPNDILLMSFNEEYKSLYLVKNERTADNRFSIIFSSPSEVIPELEIIEPIGYDNSTHWYILDNSIHNDTLDYWITDSVLIKSDSIKVNMKYLHTDTLDNLTFTNDTVYFNISKTSKRKKEIEKKEKEKRKNKEREDSITDTIPRIPLISFSVSSPKTIDVYNPLRFRSDTPIDSISPNSVRLSHKVDTLWEEIGIVELKRDTSMRLLDYRIDFEWEPGGEYSVAIDSMALHNIYGIYNGTIKSTFNVKKLEEYSNLFFKMKHVVDSAFVELLNSDDKVLYIAPVTNGEVNFFNINPGEYYARLILDINDNGKWDTGNYSEHRQPEEVYYYPKKISLKQNWDVEQEWDIYELPIDTQKPMAIKKNKPKGYRATQNEDINEEEEPEFGTNFSHPNTYTGNKYNDSKNKFDTPRNLNMPHKFNH